MMSEGSSPVQGRSFRGLANMPVRLELDCEVLTWLAVAVGVGLRVLEYALNRPLYMDERSLLANLVPRPIFDVWTTLTEHQLAPPGFLVLERIMVRLPLPTVPSARLLPLLCAIASVFVFRRVARLYLDRAAVPLATAFFAFGDYLLYYSSEIKQYSSDVLLTLVALELAGRPLAAELESRRRLTFLAAFGAGAVWFSFPIALVLAGVGIRMIFSPLAVKQYRQAFRAVMVCVVWGLSFLGCLLVGERLLDRSDRFMTDWWNFAFLPFPPRSVKELVRTFWQILNVFDNPACLFSPLTPPITVLLDLAFFILGIVSLARRWRGGAFLLVAPVLFALVASVLHKYPYHGRLLLFLVPSIHLLVGQGAAVAGRVVGRHAFVALAVFLLVQPVANTFLHHMFMSRARVFDSHGDIYPDLLDYLDKPPKLSRVPPLHRDSGLHRVPRKPSTQ